MLDFSVAVFVPVFWFFVRDCLYCFSRTGWFRIAYAMDFAIGGGGYLRLAYGDSYAYIKLLRNTVMFGNDNKILQSVVHGGGLRDRFHYSDCRHGTCDAICWHIHSLSQSPIHSFRLAVPRSSFCGFRRDLYSLGHFENLRIKEVKRFFSNQLKSLAANKSPRGFL